jgi:hypothetical protein
MNASVRATRTKSLSVCVSLAARSFPQTSSTLALELLDEPAQVVEVAVAGVAID